MDTAAAKNLFSTAQSEQGPSESGGGFTRFEERGEVAGPAYGPVRLNAYAGLPYDYGAALADETEVSVKVSMHRVMTWAQASNLLQGLLAHSGLKNRADGLQYAYHRGILLAYAKNSASVIQPDRAEILVGGVAINFYQDVMRLLGADARRFFRAYADMTRSILRDVIKKYREGRTEYADDFRDIMWVANDRGLARYPDLIHDGADAGSDLTAAEHTALRMAKASLFSQITNGVDTARLYRQATAKSPQVAAFSPTGEGPEY